MLTTAAPLTHARGEPIKVRMLIVSPRERRPAHPERLIAETQRGQNPQAGTIGHHWSSPYGENRPARRGGARIYGTASETARDFWEYLGAKATFRAIVQKKLPSSPLAGAPFGQATAAYASIPAVRDTSRDRLKWMESGHSRWRVFHVSFGDNLRQT